MIPFWYSLLSIHYPLEGKEEYKNIILLIGEPVVLSRKSIKYEVETSGKKEGLVTGEALLITNHNSVSTASPNDHLLIKSQNKHKMRAKPLIFL